MKELDDLACTLNRIFLVLLCAFFILGFLLGLIVGGATASFAHEAKAGWAYPFACCSGIDCREVPDADIVEDARGFTIRRTGELLRSSDPKVKSSPDGRYHWCSQQGADNTPTICLFVPPRAF